MNVHLETDRLILRRFTPDDADNLLELDGDPEVRRYLLMPEPPTRADAARTLARFLAWYERPGGFGYWAAVEKATGAFLGWFQFHPSRDNPHEVSLGYRLKRSAWGRGYATEGARALIRKGFEEQEVQRVVAAALAANAASRRVMEKAGLTLVKTFLYEGQEAVEYGQDRDQAAGKSKIQNPE
jgi:RimJ/RimL family protein N-acetyltransferase